MVTTQNVLLSNLIKSNIKQKVGHDCVQKLNKIKPKILCETNIISISSDFLTK